MDCRGWSTTCRHKLKQSAESQSPQGAQLLGLSAACGYRIAPVVRLPARVLSRHQRGYHRPVKSLSARHGRPLESAWRCGAGRVFCQPSAVLRDGSTPVFFQSAAVSPRAACDVPPVCGVLCRVGRDVDLLQCIYELSGVVSFVCAQCGLNFRIVFGLPCIAHDLLGCFVLGMPISRRDHCTGNQAITRMMRNR